MTSAIPEEVFFKFLEKEKVGWKGFASAEVSRLAAGYFGFCAKNKTSRFFGEAGYKRSEAVGFRKMIAEKAVDYFAMDIKTSPSRYGEIVAVKPPRGGLTATIMEEIKKSKEIIQNSGLPYEFRTTAVKGKHTGEIFEEIGEWLKGAEAYFIQNFRNKKTLDEEYKNEEGFSEDELAEFKLLMEKYVKNCGIRM